MLLQDFAENRKSIYGIGEVKQAFYGKKQVQLHPTVAFYRDSEDQLVKYTLVQLSDHLDRHFNVVANMTDLAIEELKKVTKVEEVILWRELCVILISILRFCFCSFFYLINECWPQNIDNFNKQW